MSIRAACTNGHKFTVGPEFIQQRRACPKCAAKVSWSFRLRCSKGHSLKVPGKYAGQQGNCPDCGETVRIPEIDGAESAETLVTNLLLDEPSQTRHAEHGSSDDVIGGSAGSATPSWQAALAELKGEVPPGGQDGAASDASGSLDGAPTNGDGWVSRQCPQCSSFVELHHRSCPTCGKYIGEPRAEEIARSQRCNSCGAMSFPGAAACTACGIPFG